MLQKRQPLTFRKVHNADKAYLSSKPSGKNNTVEGLPRYYLGPQMDEETRYIEPFHNVVASPELRPSAYKVECNVSPKL